VILIIFIFGLNLFLLACGETVGVATRGTDDPYAGLDADGVMRTYFEAYRTEKYEVCVALLGPLSGKSLEEFKLLAADMRRRNGKIEEFQLGGEQTGTQRTYSVYVRYTGQTKFATNPGTFRLGLTPKGWRVTEYTFL
jgi:hypothetical protein